MKRVLMVATLMCCTIPAFSQKAEIFGGYSWARQGSDNLNYGWVGSVTGNFTRWFGIEGAVNGQYLSEDVVVVSGGSVVTATGKLNILTYRAGPRFAFRSEASPVTPFAHVLVGGSRTTVSGSANVGGASFSASAGENGLSALGGGGIDIGRGPVAVRTEVGYSLLRLNGLNSNGVQVSAGVVFRIP